MDAFLRDVHASWRNVRARRWRAVLGMALLAVALAANTVVFSTADSFVFHRLPYPHADRLVQIINQNPIFAGGDSFVTPAVLAEWQRHTDLFAGVQGYLTKNLFLVGLPGTAEAQQVAVADVTPGLIELLQVAPRWGRTLTREDAAQLDPQVVLVSEGLAIERFGAPEAAVGKTLETSGTRLLVAGVMPADFHFPYSRIRIWRVMDPAGPLTRGFVGVSDVARLAPGVPFDAAAAAVRQRGAGIASAAGLRQPYKPGLSPLELLSSSSDEGRMFLVLLGTAMCLLLTACANVASLELAHAVRQVRTYAIHVALGATRGRVVRTTVLEGLILTGSAVALAMPLAREGARAVGRYLPVSLGTGPINTIDLDARALTFMVTVAGAIWLLSVLPVLLFAIRTNVVESLKTEGLAAAASPRGVIARRILTIAEIAAAIVLPCGSILYARTYASLVGLEKGFDSRNLAVATITLPLQFYPDPAAGQQLARTVLGRLEASRTITEGIIGSPPPDVGFRMTANMIIDGALVGSPQTLSAFQTVGPDYFSALRIRLLRGRGFASDERATSVIVADSFARRFWPGGDAVGHTFRSSPGSMLRHVVGVVADVRNDLDPPGVVGSRVLQAYAPVQPPQPMPSRAQTVADNGGSYGFLDLTLRVDSPERARAILPLIRQIDPRAPVSLDFVDDLYADRYADRLLATRVIGAFGMLAFIIAAAGIYGLMVFLVATRRREIGIRMALGADASSIGRLVVSSAIRLVSAGIALGGLAGIIGSRWIASQLFGVRPTDPATWLAVTLAIVGIALFATWHPARTAAALDPSQLLRE
jgi:putative ABC transport system permease protein